MAEILELVSGREEEEAADPATPGVALALDGATQNPQLHEPISRFLAANEALIADQRHHMRLKHFSDRLKVLTQLMTLTAGVAILAALGALVVNAMTSHAVVVESFKSAPSLAARGLSGDVAAAAVMDRLTLMQDRTRRPEKRLVSGAWDNDIKSEVPETGLSISELGRLLRHWLGHDTTITGDLVQEAGGELSLTVRGDGIEPKTVKGPPEAFDSLAQAAAEHIYGEAETDHLWAYLHQQNRDADALRLLEDKFHTFKVRDRPDVLYEMAQNLNGLGRYDEADERFREVIRLKPDDIFPRRGFIGFLRRQGREAEAFRELAALKALIARTPKLRMPQDFAIPSAALTQDWPAYLAAARAESEHDDGGGNTLAAPNFLANADMNLHDWAGGDLALLTATDGDLGKQVSREALEGRRALEEGRFADAAVALQAAVDHATPATRTVYEVNQCWLGLAYFLSGQPDKAQAALQGPPFVTCEAVRGDGLEHQGDRAGADAQYAKAVALAPESPIAYHHWGLALLARGDLNGAAAKFAAAHARGPHWADPLKGWGDALLRQGKTAEAAAKYDEALEYAPHWQSLLESAAKLHTRPVAGADGSDAVGVIDREAPGVLASVEDVLLVGPGQGAELVLPQIVPDVLHGVELG